MSVKDIVPQFLKECAQAFDADDADHLVQWFETLLPDQLYWWLTIGYRSVVLSAQVIDWVRLHHTAWFKGLNDDMLTKKSISDVTKEDVPA